MDWSPRQYGKFEDERNRPVRDLLAALGDAPVATAVDLGCGPGNSTALLKARFPDATISGMDSSPAMLEAARQRLPGVRFSQGDIAQWDEPGPFDLVFANASLQWVPDHAALLPMLLGKLTPGGRLAVQVPDNLDEPAHRLMRAVAAEAPWAAKLGRAAGARAARHDPAWYYGALSAGARHVDLWRTTYHHVIPGGADGLIEWFKGTGLRPFLDPLAPDEATAFLARYRERLAGAYPALPGGAVLLPFPRLFFVATR